MHEFSLFYNKYWNNPQLINFILGCVAVLWIVQSLGGLWSIRIQFWSIFLTINISLSLVDSDVKHFNTGIIYRCRLYLTKMKGRLSFYAVTPAFYSYWQCSFYIVVNHHLHFRLSFIATCCQSTFVFSALNLVFKCLNCKDVQNSLPWHLVRFRTFIEDFPPVNYHVTGIRFLISFWNNVGFVMTSSCYMV